MVAAEKKAAVLIVRGLVLLGILDGGEGLGKQLLVAEQGRRARMRELEPANIDS